MRRTAFLRGHACFLVFAFLVCTRPVPARAGEAEPQGAVAHHPASPSLTPQQALDRLMEGNRRFVEGKAQHPHQTKQWRAGLTTGQHPIAAILGCSDSRVPVEELFDQGFGDLFVIRVAGNVAAEDERGSIEYAVAHLAVPLVLVVGHEQCGAVTAALSPEAERRHEAAEVQALLARIDPALKALASGTPAERVQRGVEANARMAVAQLIETPLLKERIARKELQVKAAAYELGTGRIRLLE
jgi:carbonic anhydrase